MNDKKTAVNSIIETSSTSTLLKIAFFFLRMFISYISYSTLTYIVIICVSFILIIGINFSKNELSLSFLAWLIPIIKFLGVENKTIYGINDIMILFSKVSLIFAIIGSIISFIYKKITGNKLVGNKRVMIFFYLALISIFFLISVISCFLAPSKKNAVSIIPILVFIWVTALSAYIWYLLLNLVKEYLNKKSGSESRDWGN